MVQVKKSVLFLLTVMTLAQTSGCATSAKTAEEFREIFFADTYTVDRDFDLVMKHIATQANKCLNTKIRVTKTVNGSVNQKADHLFVSDVSSSGDTGQLSIIKTRYVAGTDEVIHGPNYAYVVDFKSIDANKTEITTYSTFIVYKELNAGLKAWAEKGAKGCPDISGLTKMAYM